MGTENKYINLFGQEERQKDETSPVCVPDPSACPDPRDENSIPLHYLDPRDDLKKDHDIWVMVLGNAIVLQGMEELYGVLHWIRCGGAMFERINAEFGFKLVRGQWDREAAGIGWDEVKVKHLGPVRDKLLELLTVTNRGGRLPFGSEVFKGQGTGFEEPAMRQTGLVFGETDPKQYRKTRGR